MCYGTVETAHVIIAEIVEIITSASFLLFSDGIYNVSCKHLLYHFFQWMDALFQQGNGCTEWQYFTKNRQHLQVSILSCNMVGRCSNPHQKTTWQWHVLLCVTRVVSRVQRLLPDRLRHPPLKWTRTNHMVDEENMGYACISKSCNRDI